MPKLTRKTQKIFCGNADNDQLAVFGSMATGSPVYTNDVEQLQSNTAYSDGWQAATLEDKAPFMEEMNGLQYSSSYQLAYLLQQGIPEWDDGTTYYNNSYVVASDGNIYKSNTDDNIGNNPISDSENWFNIALYGANVDLSNLSSIGADKLNTSKMYLTGSISTDEQGYNQLEDVYHSTFDLSKFTVLGSPVITDGGVASGFSASNYLQTENFDASSFKTMSIISKFKYSTTENTSGTNTQLIWQMRNSWRLECTSTYIRVNGFTKKPTININVSNNDVIETEVVVTPTNVTLKVNINGVKFSDTQANNDIVLPNVAQYVNIPCPASTYYFTGSIDLKFFSIKIDGIPVFNSNKTGLDVIKEDDYLVVGSPTISEDGVASGFSGSNGVKVPLDLSTTKDFAIEFDFSKTENITQNVGICSFNNIIAYIQSNNSIQVFVDNTYSQAVKLNSLAFKLKIENDKANSRFLFNVYEHNILVGQIPFTDGYSDLSQILLGGGFYSGSQYGKIDLNTFKAYVDDDLIYQACLKIPYTQSKTGSKIVPAYARGRVQDVYAQFGQAEYYTIDEEQKNFTLPMGEIYGMMVNKNLSNVEPTQSFIDKIIEYTSIDYSAGIEISFPAENAPFIAPSDGVYITAVHYNNRTAYLYINGTKTSFVYSDPGNVVNVLLFEVSLSKGDVIYWNNTLVADTSTFYPLKGAN